jgi:hypothetical protein
MSEQSHNPALEGLMRDFLIWVDCAPRTRADVMEAWRSSCPRLTVWEDALIAGLVRLDGSSVPQRVELTAQGRSVLERGPRD